MSNEAYVIGVDYDSDSVRTIIVNTAAAWILAGGAHHTGYSQNLTSEHMEDFAEMAGIEYVRIGKQTDLYQFKNELRSSEVHYR